jgi:hypothetical protein
MLKIACVLIAALVFGTGSSARAADKTVSIPDIFLHMFRTRAGAARSAWFKANAAGRAVSYKAKVYILNREKDGANIFLEYGFGDAVVCKIPIHMLPQIQGLTKGAKARCEGTLSRYSQSLGSIFVWIDTQKIEQPDAN